MGGPFTYLQDGAKNTFADIGDGPRWLDAGPFFFHTPSNAFQGRGSSRKQSKKTLFRYLHSGATVLFFFSGPCGTCGCISPAHRYARERVPSDISATLYKATKAPKKNTYFNLQQINNNTNMSLTEEEIIPHKTDVGALANRINMETRTLHNKIDKLVTLKFALALRDYKIYRQGLQSFYHVFATVERQLHAQLAKNDEWSELLQKVWKPVIARSEPAQQDLLFYYNDRKEKFMNPIMPAQIEFVDHITKVTLEKPYLLFAYLHVMYLALFAGGRVMRLSISRATGLFPQKDGLNHDDIVKLGTNFFRFDVDDENTFRLLYKRDYELATRNALTEEQKLDIIEESKYIFQQNAKCVIELEHHNLTRIKKKWSYFFATRGYYVAIALFAVAALLVLSKLLRTLF